MGRTDQVLTGGSLSHHQLTEAMKAVLTLLLVCLVVQISSAEQEDISDAASNEPNLSLQREVREAAKGCESGNKKCGGRSRKGRKRKKATKVEKPKKGKKPPKRQGNAGNKKLTRKREGKKKRQKIRRQPGKKKKKKRKKREKKKKKKKKKS